MKNGFKIIILISISIFIMLPTSVYANESLNVCSNPESEELLKVQMKSIMDLMEEYEASETIYTLKEIKKKIKSEKKELKRIEIEKDYKWIKKSMNKTYTYLNSAISNKISFIKNGKIKKKDKAEEKIKYAKKEIEEYRKYGIDEFFIENGILEQSFSYEDEGLLIIKANITPSLGKKRTRMMNYINVINIIQKQVGLKYDEIQYWAISGSDGKVISFTLNKELIEDIFNDKNNKILDEIESRVDDLWLTPSLREEYMFKR